MPQSAIALPQQNFHSARSARKVSQEKLRWKATSSEITVLSTDLVRNFYYYARSKGDFPTPSSSLTSTYYPLGVFACFAISLNFFRLPPGRRRYLVIIGIKLSVANVSSATRPLLFLLLLLLYMAATQNGGS